MKDERLEVLKLGLNDSYGNIRQETLRKVFGFLPLPEEILIKIKMMALEDDHAYVALTAAEVMFTLRRDTQLSLDVYAKWNQDSDSFIRNRCLSLLGDINIPPDIIPELVQKISEAKISAKEKITILSIFRGLKDTDLFIQSTRKVWEIFSVVGKRERLYPFLQDPMIDIDPFIDLLEKDLRNENVSLQVDASALIYKIKDIKTRKKLWKELLQSSSDFVKENIIKNLADTYLMLGEEEEGGLLKNLYENPEISPASKKEIIRSMSSDDVDFLLEIYKKEDPTSRKYIMEYLFI